MEELESLIRASQAGDRQAFAGIVARFQVMAFGYAHAILGDFHQAEDVTQEAFVAAYCGLAGLRDPAAFAGWLRQIVRFQCNRLLRSRRPDAIPLDQAAEPGSVLPGPQALAQDRETAQAALRAVRSLSDPLREVTTLFYIDGYSHQEISAFLEVPVNTVKSRLNASRRQLSDKVIHVARQALDANGPADDFAAKVLEGIPRVGFHRGGNACPESFPFSSCLAACLRFMGDDRGTRQIEGHGRKWLLNEGYLYLMGASGEAFRLLWRPSWDLGNSGLLGRTPDSRQFFEHAFAAIGHGYEIVHRQDRGVDEAVMRDRIRRSIQDAGRPVLGFGVVGPPECCIITGLDRAGEVLMGWSFFQDAEDFSPGLDFEPCGYFRKRGWFADTQALILLGERTGPVSSEEVYRKSLQRAIDLIRRPTLDLDGPWPSGLAAFTAWAETIVRNQDFPAGDLAVLRQRHLAHSSTVGMVAEGRWYGSLFLKAAAEATPGLAGPLQQAAACFEQEHKLMWQIWNLAGGLGFDEEKVLRFAEPSIREQIAPLLYQARALDSQAADHLEEALGKGLGSSS
jgi:RNA polymerase sigma factor (sigma-70 family)